jgi:uncharacterized protein (TIGR03067 family)
VRRVQPIKTGAIDSRAGVELIWGAEPCSRNFHSSEALMKALMLLIATVQAGPPGGKTDKEKLSGAWMALEVEDNGQAFENQGVQKTKIVFDGDKMIAHMSQDGIRTDRDAFTFELDPTKKPKRITLTKANGAVWLGIYSLDKNNLKICVAHRSAKAPPSDFKAKKGSKAILFILQSAMP